jgi:uncharacterized protein Yka (UPF0111/DUF47 family)
MRGDRIVKFFMPKEERFHELLDRDTQHLLRATRLFADIAASRSLDERRAKVAELKAREHEGDQITKEILSGRRSTRGWRTPATSARTSPTPSAT